MTRLNSTSGAIQDIEYKDEEIERIQEFLQSSECPVKIEIRYKNEENWIKSNITKHPINLQ